MTPRKPQNKSLAQLEAAWRAAREQASKSRPASSTSIPDGNYLARLTDAASGESNGVQWIRLDFVVESEGYEGERLTRFLRLEENGLQLLARTCQALGLDVASLSAVADELAAVAARQPLCRIRVLTRDTDAGTFTNVYVNGLASTDSPSGQRGRSRLRR